MKAANEIAPGDRPQPSQTMDHQAYEQACETLKKVDSRIPSDVISQLILLEGKIRPANWSYRKNLQRCDMPTFGAFYLGREVSNSDKTIPEWAARELLDTIQKKGKGQQDIVFGAMYRGANVHTAYKADGNDMAQLAVAEKGIVTTSEKYTIAHSNHMGLKFVALKWQNLTNKINVGDSSSEDLNYRTTEERYSGRR